MPIPDMNTVLTEIIHERENGCTDEQSAYRHFERRFKLSDNEMRLLSYLLRSINYAAIRENQDGLRKLLGMT